MYLRQSTAVDLPLGPFVDAADGFTAETGLTLTQPDIRLKKNGAAWAQKNAAQTLAHEENGWYEVALDTTDTNTLGHLVLAVHESGARPVERKFLVVPPEVYDAMILGTGGEPGQGAPPVSASWVTKLAYLYKWLRNKSDQSLAGDQQLYADDGTTVDHKRTITDVAGTTTRGEIVSGP